MGQVERELRIRFLGIDQVTPALNSMTGGLTNVARVSQNAASQMTGMGGMLSREWEKFRKTFGYAFAGAATYKVFQAYQNLKQYNSELGTLNAMLPNAGRSIDQIGEVALRVSTATGAPLNEVQQSINNIVQSIPDMSAAARQHLIPAMAQIEAMSSRIMDVDPRSFGSTVLGIARAYNPIGQLSNPKTGPQILERIASQLYTTRISTPRLTGQDITQYIPTLVGGARAGRFSLEQSLALFSVAQQTIQRPATTTQYLRQLMLRIRKPTRQEEPYFAQAGLTPQTLASMSGMEILNRLIKHGLSLPGGINREALRHATQTGDYSRIAATGQAAQFFQNAVGGRMQSLVAMTALASNWGQVRLQLDRLAANSNDISKAFERWKTRNSLMLMSNALNNATTNILQNFMPALSIGADGLTKAGTELQGVAQGMRRMDRHINNYVLGKLVNPAFAQKHNIVGGLLDTTLTVGSVMALMRSPAILRRVGLGRLLEGRSGAKLMAPFAAAETASAAASALAGQATGTSSQPFWVVIHPLSMTTVPKLFGGSTDKKKDTIEHALWNKLKGVVGGAAGGLGVSGLASRLSMAGAGLSSLALADVLLVLSLGGDTPQGGGVSSQGNNLLKRMRRDHVSGSWLTNAVRQAGGNPNATVGKALSDPRIVRALAQDLSRLENQRIRSRASHSAVAHGVVEATINLEPTQELKGLLKPQTAKAHIPTKLWDLSASPPTERGKAKVTRNR